MKFRKSFLAASILVSAQAAAASANVPMWSEGACDSMQDGATREYYNGATYYPWANFMGDWTDANGTAQGSAPFAEVVIEDRDFEQTITTDVTSLVKAWHEGTVPNQGFFLKAVKNGTAKIKSSQYPQDGVAPTLFIETTAGSYVVPVASDTFLTASTYKCMGSGTELSTGGNILMHFDLADARVEGEVLSADLQLKTTNRQYGKAVMHVYRTSPKYAEYDNGAEGYGIAGDYPNDRNLQADGRVYMVEDFEDENFIFRFSGAQQSKPLDLVGSEFKEDGFLPLSGKALKVQIDEGERIGLNLHYRFQDHYGMEPEEANFRYYIRIGDGWETVQGGKFPGLAGTYEGKPYAGGWGGRSSDGDNGWSARTYFSEVVPGNNPETGNVPVGTYLYHGDMTDQYGEPQQWDGGNGLGILERNRWYAVEQHVKLNTPGQNDGVVKVWIDGQPVMHKTDINFRNAGNDHIKIESAWLDVYHGGTAYADRTIRVFIDNMVVATDYIGPTKFSSDPADSVLPVNNAPRISNPLPATPDVNADIGQAITFSAGVTEMDGEFMEIKWVHNGETVLSDALEYTFTPGLVDDGAHTIELVATDASGNEAKQVWNVNVNGGDIIKFDVAEDTYVEPSSFAAMGVSPELKSRGNMYFKVPADQSVNMNDIAYAKLMLYTTEQLGDTTYKAFAATSNWTEGTDSSSGLTRDFANMATGTSWQSNNGDYIDYEGNVNGDRPYSIKFVEDTDQARFVEVDVTLLVKEQWANGEVNIALASEGKTQTFISKDAGDNYRAPRLVLIKSNGQPLPVIEAPKPVLKGSNLNELAAQLQPGQWAELETANYSNDLMIVNIDGRKLHIAGWTDEGFWDADLQKFMFLGMRIRSKFLTLDGATGTWTAEEEPFVWPTEMRKGHIYGNNAYNANTKTFYHAAADSKTVLAYNVNTPEQGWVAMPELPILSGVFGSSLEYVEAVNSLFWLGQHGLYQLKLNETEWKQISGPMDVGYHSMMRYNPIKQELLIMGGDDAERKVVKVAMNGEVTYLQDSPVNMNIRADKLYVNPDNGHYVMISGRTMVNFDSSTETYTVIDQYISPFGQYEKPFGSVLQDKGVILFTDEKTRLFKPYNVN